jgi:hypothetical protein
MTNYTRRLGKKSRREQNKHLQWQEKDYFGEQNRSHQQRSNSAMRPPH